MVNFDSMYNVSLDFFIFSNVNHSMARMEHDK